MKKTINNTPTPHNEALKGQIAPRVIMPGDPKRAKWIATSFLKNPKLVSDVRGICCYTGTYKNKKVSVMAHGMGIPSICIYTHELFNFYDVDTIYRVGSTGVDTKAGLTLGDVVLTKSAWSDVPVERWLNIKLDGKNRMLPSAKCNKNIIATAKANKIKIHLADVESHSFFYNELSLAKRVALTGCHVCEMESFGLFAEAKYANKKAACLLTVSDVIGTKLSMSSQDRQLTFKNMIKLALDAIVKE